MEIAQMQIQQITEPGEWAEILGRFNNYDVYHTYDYSLLSKTSDGSFSLLHVIDSELEFVFPLVQRTISCRGQQYNDLGSVYGYPGPLYSGHWTNERLVQVWAEVVEYLKQRDIVSLVSRLNPFVDVHCSAQSVPELKCIGVVKEINSVIGIDVSRPEEEQVLDYRSNHRRDIKKLKKNGIRCDIVDPALHLKDFVVIYNETMKRLDATEEYYFSLDYYDSLFAAESFDTQLLMCFTGDDKPICGGIFFTTGSILHYHLGATSTEYLRLAPSKLLFDTARSYATRYGCKYLNLGGGVGGMNDSLYNFKAGFSKTVFNYSVFMSILNDETYADLVEQRRQRASETHSVIDENYFPRYRAGIVCKSDSA